MNRKKYHIYIYKYKKKMGGIAPHFSTWIRQLIQQAILE